MGGNNALNGIAYKDDVQVVEGHVIKEYVTEGFVTGVKIRIDKVTDIL